MEQTSEGLQCLKKKLPLYPSFLFFKTLSLG